MNNKEHVVTLQQQQQQQPRYCNFLPLYLLESSCHLLKFSQFCKLANLIHK